MTLSCSDATLSLGAYVLGALDPPERAEVEAHLAGCPRCRDELSSLAPLPGLMSRLTLDEVVAGPPSLDGDSAMLERLLAAASGERRVATHRRWLAAAAAVVVLGGGTGGALAWQAAQGPQWAQVASSSNGPVHVSVRLADQSGGTRVEMALHGVRSEERCRLVAVSRDGHSETAGWWEASYSGTATMTGTTSIARKDLAKLKVVTDAGQTLVVVPV
jgi:predicted anti-sigma-YlaC factor YlaD